MRNIADDMKTKGVILECKTIYANGGSGLFLVDADQEEQIEAFARRVQQTYTDDTQGGASVTYVIQELPKDAPQDKEVLKGHNLEETLNLLRNRMRLHKDCPPEVITLPSHPFMRPCDSCGINYAEEVIEKKKKDRDPTDDPLKRYCASCQTKQYEDYNIKKNILPATLRYQKGTYKHPEEAIMKEELWKRIIYRLIEDGYVIPQPKVPERPPDFNIFRQFSKSKEYIGLIYADANNMGTEVEKQETLTQLQEFSLNIDSAIHRAMSAAIIEHLPVEPG
ncbi:MAG TPA: hypothetical protein VL485_16780, partial [Ktedonobacteraceae bacterium]|nr:hypothetical protein [Ktedonobacteraceae bacterium]